MITTYQVCFDDGFQEYLTEGATYVGDPGIPMLMNFQSKQVPESLLPFSRAKSCKNKRQYIHFYMHDNYFTRILTSTHLYLDRLKEYDGVITPDCTMLIGQSKCLQQTNTYMNRAVGFYLQKNGVNVIPNVRWSDESSFQYCFLGIPKDFIVSVSTHGCIRGKVRRQMFKTGLQAMIEELRPSCVLVHGYMPNDIFQEFMPYTKFLRYPSEFEITHRKGVK